MVSSENKLRSNLTNRLSEVLAYRGVAAYAEFLSLLEAIEDCYKEDLLTVKPELLQYKQGAAAQVRVLRKLLIEAEPGAINDAPKI